MIVQIAKALAAIHRVPLVLEDVAFLEHDGGRIERLLARELPADRQDVWLAVRIRTALAAAGLEDGPPSRPVTLLHGDFWPGNILGRDGAIRAILDWENAAIGNPLRDLANLRLELCWAAGEPAMHEVTAHYAAAMQSWDLLAALKPVGTLAQWDLNSDVETAMRLSHQKFVDNALARLE